MILIFFIVPRLCFIIFLKTDSKRNQQIFEPFHTKKAAKQLCISDIVQTDFRQYESGSLSRAKHFSSLGHLVDAGRSR